MTAHLREILLPTLGDLVPSGVWSSAWHCEEAIDEVAARAALAGKLPFGTIVEHVELLGYNDGIDGTVVLVRSIYSHS